MGNLRDVQFKGTAQHIIFKGTDGGLSARGPQATELDEEILGNVQFKGTEQNIIFKGTGGGPSSTSPQATELAGGRGI